jgi:hypothetical protein
MINTKELAILTNLNAAIWGTFLFPRMLNAKGVETPFIASDAPDAEQLIQDWYIKTSKVVPFRFYAFPEVLERDGRTQTPLHYQTLFAPKNPRKFMRVAQRKWDKLLRNRFPNARHHRESLWLEWIDRNDVEKIDLPEFYCLKQQDIDWNWNHRLTDEMVKPMDKSNRKKIAA